MSRSQFEFDDNQNRLIGDLARKMSLVGFVIVLFGALQMVHGVMTLWTSRNPDRIVAAAKDAGVSATQLEAIERVASGGLLSPLAISAMSFALTGLLLVVVGVWTQQAATGFRGIVRTRGEDIRRLMAALAALHKKYSLIYTLIWVAAILSLISLGIGLYYYFTRAG